MSNQKTIKSALISVFSKKGLEPIVRKLYENKINTIEKILKMKKNELLDIEGFKEKSADNLIKSIKKAVSDKSLAEIMNASNKLGSGMGIERMKMITSTYPKILTNNWSKKELIEKDLTNPEVFSKIKSDYKYTIMIRSEILKFHVFYLYAKKIENVKDNYIDNDNNNVIEDNSNSFFENNFLILKKIKTIKEMYKFIFMQIYKLKKAIYSI